MVFVGAYEDSIMADDATTSLNPLVTPIEEEELEKTLFDVNVSQRQHEEEPFKRMVRTQVNCSTWDHQLSLNPYALTIY